MDVVEFSQRTKQEAEELLRYGNVMEVLSKRGKAAVSGSYSYDLMYGPDIDVTVICDNPEQFAFDALRDFVEQRNFQKYQLGDFIRFPRKDRPQAMIVVLLHEHRGRRWEIEIWFQRTVSEDEQLNKLISTATPEQRRNILELKHQREIGGLSKHNLDSITIYKGVLLEGKFNIEDYQ